ncbi:hypothetical protein AGMMS49992_09250 [Clostridia bacterium]|nr:hypothetical protein AGMMS49992_09250 [Clostridia bacterium]
MLLYIFATIIIGNKILSSNSGQPINGNNSSMENIKMKILKTVAILLAVMTCLHWVISDQKVYATAEINKTRADSYFTRLITQLEINGAIDNERSIAFIGYAPEIHYDKINYNISDSSIDYSAVPKWVLLTGLKTTNHINNPFFRDIVSYFYGIDLPKLTEEQKVKLVRKTDELLDLPIYPAYGSINIIAVDENEYLTVVKLSNEVDVVR